MNCNIDIKFTIVKHINDIDDFKSLLSTNKKWNTFWNEHKEYICKLLLQAMNVDYKDPSNYIYIMYEEDHKLDRSYYDLLRIYSKSNNKIDINCSSLGITSIPKLPKLKELCVCDNKLTSIKINSDLEVLCCSGNELTSISIAGDSSSSLIKLLCINNNLTSIPKLDKLKTLECCYNPLPSIPVMNNLEKIICSKECLTSPIPLMPLLDHIILK